jgi:hypothetical protein
MQARANLCRRAELALVVCAVRDQRSERGEAGEHAGRVPQPPSKRPGGDQLIADIIGRRVGLEPATRGVEIRYLSRFFIFIEKPKITSVRLATD